ncbi:hypothetical protein ACFYN5_33660 [Streptomyces sp. NPDC007126]|uniref:hypothetical protein n=1 Tax=Streptomyces sp. NPDC007126 TaxID=3364774 RepID=UPI00368FB0E3
MTERLENPTQHCRRPLPRTTLGARFVLTAEEPAALPILDSRPDEATVARGFEEVDAGCWSDSGDVTVYAERTYAFPGTGRRGSALPDGSATGRMAPRP